MAGVDKQKLLPGKRRNLSQEIDAGNRRSRQLIGLRLAGQEPESLFGVAVVSIAVPRQKYDGEIVIRHDLFEPVESFEDVVSGRRSDDLRKDIVAGGKIDDLRLHVCIEIALLPFQSLCQALGVASAELNIVEFMIFVICNPDEERVQ